jgi:plasmid replication initiation protein
MEFVFCDILDAVPKDDMATMEHPVFSLSTRPDRRILRYAHGPVRIEITPSVKGLATIYDKDILIYCVSQLVARLNRASRWPRELRLTAQDLMRPPGARPAATGTGACARPSSAWRAPAS